MRVDAGAVRLDGRLDEEVWQLAEPVDDFTQKEPTEGALPVDRMEVRFVYDDPALCRGAHVPARVACDPGAARAAGQRRTGGAHHPVARHVPGPAHGGQRWCDRRHGDCFELDRDGDREIANAIVAAGRRRAPAVA